MSDNKPTTFVIFGASGDLTRRKLIPALFNSYCKGRLPENFLIVGFARRPWDDEQLRQILREGMQELASDTYDAEKWESFAPKISYAKGDLSTVADFQALQEHLAKVDGQPGYRLS